MGKACQLSAVEQQKIEQWIAAHGTPQQVGADRQEQRAFGANLFQGL
jgi:hypothetical protein